MAYDCCWPGDFAVLAGRIQAALGPAVVRVSHVGSISVPGLAAKDCIDIQVEVRVLDEDPITGDPAARLARQEGRHPGGPVRGEDDRFAPVKQSPCGVRSDRAQAESR